MAPPDKLLGEAFHDLSKTGPRASHNIPDGGVFSVYASTAIHAPPQAVYDAILDVRKWKEWNTFVPEVTITSHPHSHSKDIKMTEGVNMTFHVKMKPDEQPTTSKETCTHVSHVHTRANHGPPAITTIRWNLHNAAIMTPGFLIKAERTNEIEEAEDGTTRYRTWQTFGGWASNLVKSRYEQVLQDRFKDWCRDLKKYVEEQQPNTAMPAADVGDAKGEGSSM